MPQGKKDDKAETKATPAAAHVRVDNSNARSDKDAYEGGFVKVVAGDHDGAKGVFVSVAEYDDSDGYPKSILVNFTDTAYKEATAVVDYADVVPADYVDPDDDAAKKQAEEAEVRTMQVAPDQPAKQVADE